MEAPRISARPLAVLTDRLALPPEPVAAALARHGLSATALHAARSDADAAIPLTAFVGVMEDLASDAGDPLVGWRFGESFDLQDLGAFGLAVSLAPTLGDALRFFERTFCTVQTGTRTRLTVEDDEATFHYAILDQDIWPRRQDAELTLGLIAGIVRRYCGDGWRPVALGFEHGANAGSRSLAGRLRREAVYGEETNHITLPAGLLDRRRPEPAAGAFSDLAREVDARARLLQRSQRLRTRVKLAVLEGLGAGPVDQTQVARALGLSRRTLRRRLEDEGVTFQQLVDECRRSRALADLTRTDRPLSEIALRLGYSDQTAFSRAFTRWFGLSPRRVRQEARGRNTTS